MVASALRTLSVFTLLSAVSATVFLVNDQELPAAGASISSPGGDSLKLTSSLIPAVDTAGADQYSARAADLAALKLEHQAAVDAAARVRGQTQLEAERKLAAQRRGAALLKATRSAARDPKSLARLMLGDRGWGADQFSCLISLWNKESRWNLRASNPSSGAYGIPQALPGSKMASAGSDWRTNPATQIRWGLNYIAARYRTPCGAWGHSQASGWY